MDWLTKLRAWNYPYAEYLAPRLEELGLNPNAYGSPFDLARDLRKFLVPERGLAFVAGAWQYKPLAWWDPIVNFFKWLGEQIWKLLQPIATPLVLIIVGGIIMWVAPGVWKAIGAVPIIIAIWKVLEWAKIIGIA